MRLRFRVLGVTDHRQDSLPSSDVSVTLVPVVDDEARSDNALVFRGAPSGMLTLWVDQPDALDEFCLLQPGEDYFLDLTKAGKPLGIEDRRSL